MKFSEFQILLTCSKVAKAAIEEERFYNMCILTCAKHL